MTSILSPDLTDAGNRPTAGRPDGPHGAPVAWVLFAIYAAAFVGWSLASDLDGRVPSSTAAAILGSLAFLPLNVGAIYWLLRASRAPNVLSREASALRLMAVMYCFTAVGNSLWAIDEGIRHVDPRRSWADLFYVVSYALGIAALTRFPVAPRGASERRDFLLDSACVVIATAALIWTFVVAPIDLQQVDQFRLGVGLLYPIGSIITLALLCRLLMRQGPHALRRDVLLLALGWFTQCVMDLILELDFRQDFARLATWAALICAATYVVIIYAAQQMERRTPVTDEGAAFPVLHPMNVLPTVAAITVYVVLIWASQSDTRASLGVLVAAALALNGLFLVKQTLAAHDNAVLQAARADAESRERYERLARESQRLESVGRLAGGIAHDFNNLLTTVLANSDFALTRMRAGTPGHDEVTDIRAAAVRGAELVRQLLAFSRKSVIAPVRLQPDLILRDMERLLERLAGDRSTLVLDLAADLGQVQADRGQLEQVLANLVTNSRDAMPVGGTVTITGRNVTLDGEAAAALALPAGAYVALAIADTGVGIPPEARAHIFEPFFSTKARGKGTGLGLASSYGIMRQSNGAIAVASEVGRGSTFTLYLPRLATVAIPTPVTVAPLPQDGRRGRGETILLVEDEAAVRQVTRRMLVAEGYTVLTAADATAARAIVATHGADIALLITDVMMPGDSGIVLAESVRQTVPGLDTIFISGYADTDCADGARSPSGDDFVQKPFTGAELLSRVESRLSRRRRRAPSVAHSR